MWPLGGWKLKDSPLNSYYKTTKQRGRKEHDEEEVEEAMMEHNNNKKKKKRKKERNVALSSSSMDTFQDKISCPICKELFHLPVALVRCAHTFCSKCLNEYMKTFQDDKKRNCPRCKGPVTDEKDWDGTGEVALRPNREMEEIVESWKGNVLEPLLLAAAGRDDDDEQEEEEVKEEEEAKEEDDKTTTVIKLPNPIPPPTKYHLLPKAKQAEKTRKTNELRDDLENKYGFDGRTLKGQTYDQLKSKYVEFRDTYNAELKLFQRKPDMKSVVKNMESIETAIREEAEKKNAKRVSKATAFFNPKGNNNNSNNDRNIIDQELMRKLVEQAGRGLSKKIGLQLEERDRKKIKKEEETIIEILSDDNEEEDEDPLPLSQPNLNYVDSEQEEEEDIVKTQEEILL
ncbi:unnamed protein product [Bathycoccus prasinos]